MATPWVAIFFALQAFPLQITAGRINVLTLVEPQHESMASALQNVSAEFELHGRDHIEARVLTPAAAAELFEAHMFRESIADRGELLNRSGPPHGTEDDGDREFAQNQMALFKQGLLPSIRVQLCVQFDIDLSTVLMPGVIVNVAIGGAVTKDVQSGCWGVEGRAAIGFQWRFKVLGKGVVFAVGFEGSLALQEVTPQTVANDVTSTTSEPANYAPTGADMNRCHSKSPWALIQTFLERQWRRGLKTDELHEQARLLRKEQEFLRQQEQHLEKYKWVLDGEHMLVESDTGPQIAATSERLQQGQGHSWVYAPRLLMSAQTMLRALDNFVRSLPAYATQVFLRLVDNRDKFGTDGERVLPVVGRSKSLKRLLNTTGRYLARWPCKRTLAKLNLEGEEPQHRTCNGKCCDQRVFNFAKAMRLSGFQGRASFWREIAMSSGNLMVRVVKDVLALFSVHFANDAAWDGSCDSMQSSFLVDDGERKELLLTHAWASEYRKPKKRRKFIKDKMPKGADLFGVPLWSDKAFGNTGSKWEMLPHFWCSLSEGYKSPTPAKSVTIQIRQSCHAVVLEGEADDVQRDSTNAPPAFAVLGARPECESVTLPPSFVTLFPSFVKRVQEYVKRIEHGLMDINFCLHASLHGDRRRAILEDRKTQIQECKDEVSRLSFVTSKAKHVTRLVRMFLIKLGAWADVDAVGKSDEPDPFPTSAQEDSLLRSNFYKDSQFAKIARRMAWDFHSAFGIDRFPPAFTDTLLSGFLWSGVDKEQLREDILTIASPLVRRESWLQCHACLFRPPLRSILHLTVRVHTEFNNFCDMSLAPLMFQFEKRTTYHSWTDRKAVESCYVGRLRPGNGNFAVAVQRCSGSENQGRGDSYVEWRVTLLDRFTGFSLSAGHGSVTSGFFDHVGGKISLEGILLKAGTGLGGLASMGLHETLLPRAAESAMAQRLVSLTSYSTPLLGAFIGEAGALLLKGGLDSFGSMCSQFLGTLMGPDAAATINPGFSGVTPGFSAWTGGWVWGTVVHRQKIVQLTANPGAGIGRGTMFRWMRSFSAGAGWYTSATFDFPIPGMLEIIAEGYVEIDFLLTPWIEALDNRRRSKTQIGRREICSNCLERGDAFCDWLPALGSLWNSGLDVCVNPSASAEQTCTQNVGIVDEDGNPKRAMFFSASTLACGSMETPSSNREFAPPSFDNAAMLMQR